MMKLTGVYPPVVTLFNSQGQLDLEANKKMADFLIESGVDGITYLGTTGEFSSLTMEEKQILITEMVEHIAGRVKVLVGIGDTCLQQVITFGNFLNNLKIDGVLLVNPYFSIYREEAVKEYYLAVDRSIQLPIIIYNFPTLTGFNFKSDLVRELLQKSKNICGIKDTIDDINHVRSMIQLKQEFPGFCVYAAFENQMLPALIMGVDGFINATANFEPETTVAMYKLFQEDAKEQKIYDCFLRACDLMSIYSFSQPLFLACKEAVYQRIFKDNSFAERLPSIGLDESTRMAIIEELDRLKNGAL